LPVPLGNDVLTPIYELAVGQFHGQELVQGRDDLEVKAVEASLAGSVKMD